MSNFRTIVKDVLKEWDDSEEYKYMDKHPEDHTGEDSMEWGMDIYVDDAHKALFDMLVAKNYVEREDVEDTDTFYLDVVAEYNVEGYPEDEYVDVKKVYVKDLQDEKIDITEYLTREDLDNLATALEESGKIDLYSYDDEADLKSDYYHSIL